MYCDDIEHLERLRTLAVETERRLRDNEPLLAARGMDVEQEIRRLQEDLARIEDRHRRSDAAFEQMLQSLADLADARRDLYRALEMLVAAAEKDHANTPEVQQARAVLEDLRREMPRG